MVTKLNALKYLRATNSFVYAKRFEPTKFYYHRDAESDAIYLCLLQFTCYNYDCDEGKLLKQIILAVCGSNENQ